MLLTAYCLDHGNWTVIPHQLEESFKDMADCGFDAVALSFSESEMCYSRRAFETQVDLAHKCGLKCFVTPSRLGGRFAGAPLMPSLWLCQNPQCQEPGTDSGLGPVACLESPQFIEWITKFMTTLVRDYPLDGIIWDEPKHADMPSRHPDTMARYGSDPSVGDNHESFCRLIDSITQRCLEIRPGLLNTVFCMGTTSRDFTRKISSLDTIHYFGYDGNLTRQSYFHEEPSWQKYRIESVWERTVVECAAGQKKTFALVENMLMPATELGDYERNLDAYLENYRPDHLGVYYYAHNNEAPEEVHAITRRLLKKHLRP